jgi:SnoaL-like domain
MNQRALLAAVLLVTGGFWIWSTAYTPAEREIRRHLDELVAAFNGVSTDGAPSMARAARLGQFLTEDVVVDLGDRSPAIHGRETVMGMAARLEPRTAAFTLALDDVSVVVLDENHAEVTMTAVIRRRSVAAGEESLDAREFSAEIRNADGGWQVSRVVAVDTLR